jgi:prepilin-type N-terminal cleavage/methylation domain-containing protein/prepilin-type processing-associated H-X9-DG protein
MAQRTRGFTLVELLVVVAIIGLLISLLLPALQQSRESARRSECQSHLRQLGIAVAAHEEARRAYPIGCMGCRFGGANSQRFHSWNLQLLPYLEQAALTRQFDLEKPSYASPNREAGATVVASFLCPSTPGDTLVNRTGLWRGMAFTDFAGIYGVEGIDRSDDREHAPHWLKPRYLGVMLYEKPVRLREIIDGASNTALIGEARDRRATEMEWANGHNVFAQEGDTPINATFGLGNELGSPHRGGASVVFCDGHVTFLSDGTNQDILNGLFTKAGSEHSN